MGTYFHDGVLLDRDVVYYQAALDESNRAYVSREYLDDKMGLVIMKGVVL